MTKYAKGKIVEATVTGIENYGVFVNLDDYYSGLIHISEISHGFVRNINNFVKVTCSNSPTPGGGSVAALLASLSASLAAMSSNLTINKKGYENVNNQMIDLAKLFENKANIYLDYMMIIK